MVTVITATRILVSENLRVNEEATEAWQETFKDQRK